MNVSSLSFGIMIVCFEFQKHNIISMYLSFTDKFLKYFFSFTDPKTW